MLTRSKVNPAHVKNLRTQPISTTARSCLLQDFQLFLDYIAENSPKAGGKYHLLPIDAIPVLDERLRQPLRLNLKRPQLRSHPVLQGLHLLLRSTGLVRVEGSGEKARLVLHAPTSFVWVHLNPTERYFTLLEAWLMFGRAEMVG